MFSINDIIDNQFSKLDNITRFSSIKVIEKESDVQHICRMQLLALYLVTDIKNFYKKDMVDIKDLTYRILVHDLEESVTGDIVRPVKYYDDRIKSEIDRVAMKIIKEKFDNDSLVNDMLHAKNDGTIEGHLTDILDSLQCAIKLAYEVNLQRTKQIKESFYDAVSILLGKIDDCIRNPNLSKINSWLVVFRKVIDEWRRYSRSEDVI